MRCNVCKAPGNCFWFIIIVKYMMATNVFTDYTETQTQEMENTSY